MNKNVYSLPMYVCTRSFHGWTLSHAISKCSVFLSKGLGYENNATTIAMARAVQNPYQPVVERQIEHQKSSSLRSATIISYPIFPIS